MSQQRKTLLHQTRKQESTVEESSSCESGRSSWLKKIEIVPFEVKSSIECDCGRMADLIDCESVSLRVIDTSSLFVPSRRHALAAVKQGYSFRNTADYKCSACKQVTIMRGYGKDGA